MFHTYRIIDIENAYDAVTSEIDKLIVDIAMEDLAESAALAATVALACLGWMFWLTPALIMASVAASAVEVADGIIVSNLENSIVNTITGMGETVVDSPNFNPDLRTFVKAQDNVTMLLPYWDVQGTAASKVMQRRSLNALAQAYDTVEEMVQALEDYATLFQSHESKLTFLQLSQSIIEGDTEQQAALISKMDDALTAAGESGKFFGISYLGALPGIISTVSLAHYTTMASGWVSKGAAMYWTATVKTFFAEDEAFSILKSGDEVLSLVSKYRDSRLLHSLLVFYGLKTIF